MKLARKSRFVRAWKQLRRWRHYASVGYETIAFLYRSDRNLRFMKYGCAAQTEEPDTVNPGEPKAERYARQLYHYAASAIPLKEKHRLEIGSSRGSGASYVQRAFGLRSTVGTDFSRQVIAFCRRVYQVEDFSFQVGNAMQLPVSAERFNVVTNIESSHTYPSLDFFS